MGVGGGVWVGGWVGGCVCVCVRARAFMSVYALARARDKEK